MGWLSSLFSEDEPDEGVDHDIETDDPDIYDETNSDGFGFNPDGFSYAVYPEYD